MLARAGARDEFALDRVDDLRRLVDCTDAVLRLARMASDDAFDVDTVVVESLVRRDDAERARLRHHDHVGARPVPITCSEPRLVESSSAMTPVKIKSPASGKPAASTRSWRRAVQRCRPSCRRRRGRELPSTTWGANGAGISPGGTVSIWPLNIRPGRRRALEDGNTLQRPSRTSCSVAWMPSRRNSREYGWRRASRGPARRDGTGSRDSRVQDLVLGEHVEEAVAGNFPSGRNHAGDRHVRSFLMGMLGSPASVGGRGNRAARHRAG